MAASIVRTPQWDDSYEQQFIAIPPLGNEVKLYLTHREDPHVESNTMVQLHLRKGFDNIQCSSYLTTQPGVLGVGSITGTVSIFNIKDQTIPEIHLRPKQPRPCNTIAFNMTNMVAVGYDKGRQDNSLQIWDIEESLRIRAGAEVTSSISTGLSTSTGLRHRAPVSSYLPNEAVLSTSFFTDSEYNLICGSYKFLRQIDLRSDAPVFQMATKCTLGLTMDPFQPNLFQSYSEDGSLAIWDRRKLTVSGGSGGHGASQRTSSSGSNSIVITESPVLQFNKLLSELPVRKIHNSCIRYSTMRRGEFAAIFNGDLIRRWHTGIVPASAENYSVGSGASGAGGASDLASSTISEQSNSETNPVLQSLKTQASKLYRSNEDSIFVSMVLDNKTDYEKVVSFDYSPDLNSHTSTNFVCMRQSGTVFRMPVVESIEGLDFNPSNEFTIVGPEGTLTNFVSQDVGNNHQNIMEKSLKSLEKLTIKHRMRRPSDRHNPGRNGYGRYGCGKNNDGDDGDDDDDDYDIETEELSTTVDDGDQSIINGGDTNREIDYRRASTDEDLVPLNKLLRPDDIFKNDICLVIKRRAAMGYALDPEINYQILQELDPNDYQLSLRNTWKWLGLAKKSLEKGTMVSEGIDLGYQGVLGIWNGAEALNDQKRIMSTGGPISNAWYTQAVRAITAAKGKKISGIHIPVNSEKKSLRKLCLIVSGWYLTEDEFEEKLQLLVSMGYVTKAAGWAVFHGNISKAIEILSESKKERYRLMATAVAGYLAYKDTNVNSPWKDQCRKMASEMDDPYLRAIFAFIADDDWWDVLDEHSLPLRERIGVAIRFLSDKDLTVYLNRIADTNVHRGELEGLILTGITSKGIDLLQSYVDRTSDVQTAALMAAFACPRYFTDPRVKHWIDSYRAMLNSWGMFKVRAKLDVARTKLSKSLNGRTTIQATPKQFYLQCTRCNKNISKPKLTNISQQAGGFNTANNQMLLKQFSKASNKRNEIVSSCPHCGAPLPRCAICLMSLGSLIPSTDAIERVHSNLTSSKTLAVKNNFKSWFSFCLSCNHCYHAHHAEEWFSKHYKCPVPDCDCQCNSK